MALPNDIDAECRSLCEAMNRFSGVTTVASCCGHGTKSFAVWFVVDDLGALASLLYWLDVWHSDIPGWVVKVSQKREVWPVLFDLSGPLGAVAYQAAEEIALRMQQCLDKERDGDI